MALVVRFDRGTRHDVDRDIVADIRLLMDAVRSGQTAQQYLDSAIRMVVWDTVRPSVESTWFALLREFLQIHRPPHCPDPASVQRDQLDVLGSLADGGTPEELWRRTKAVILEHIDSLSGWTFSMARHMAERYQEMRQPDGHYIDEVDGTRYEIMGARGVEETRIEYLIDQTMKRKYSFLHEICALVAICSICVHYRMSPAEYPDAIRLVLPGDDMLAFSWHLISSVESPRLPWRPPVRHCDPEFLVSDLVGECVSRSTVSRPAAAPVGGPAPHDTRFQHDFALDTDLRIGEGEEASLTFNGMRFRWINGTRTYCPIIIMGSRDSHDHRRAFETVNELLSILSFETRVPIVSTHGAAGRTRLLPYVHQPRKLADMVYPDGIHVSPAQPMTSNRKLALALYREGKSSRSSYYEFLCYYKILQIAFPGAKVAAWINAHALPEGRVASDRIRELIAEGISDIGKYLYDRWRNAIAHVHRPTVNPDEYEGRVRMSKDLWLVENLARTMIESDELG
ncbi:MAG: methylamine utilization protein MauJ [Candidatus Methylomirabilota bacterium]|jgi:hypothetical protein